MVIVQNLTIHQNTEERAGKHLIFTNNKKTQAPKPGFFRIVRIQQELKELYI